MYNKEIASEEMKNAVFTKMDALKKFCNRRINDGEEYAVCVPFTGEIPKKITNNITVTFFEIYDDAIILWLESCPDNEKKCNL